MCKGASGYEGAGSRPEMLSVLVSAPNLAFLHSASIPLASTGSGLSVQEAKPAPPPGQAPPSPVPTLHSACSLVIPLCRASQTVQSPLPLVEGKSRVLLFFSVW